jgi:serine protease SohB
VQTARPAYVQRMKKSLFKPKSWFARADEVSVLRLYGAIGVSRGIGGRGLSHPPLEKAIDEAFAGKRVKAVALAINSPGGAPGQSSLIARHIRRLADEKDIPVIAFCEDVAASGGYLLACAADEIFVNEYSIAGSIGVISASFGAQDAIQRIGVERRVHTAGERKVLMDPFSEERPEDVARLKALQKDIHARFIDWVKVSRKDRLIEGTPLFEGDVWVGERAVEVGLADGVGELKPVLKERFGKDVTFKDYGGEKRGLLARLMGRGVTGPSLGAGIGTGAADATIEAIEQRLAWSRYGL